MAEGIDTLGRPSANRKISSWVNQFQQAVHSSLETSYNNANAFLTAAAILTVVGHILFYLIWRYFFPQPAENIPLRLVGCLLAVPFLFRNRLPERVVPFLPLYFMVAVVYNLPIVFSYLLVQNNFSQVWVLSTLGAAFVLTFLVLRRPILGQAPLKDYLILILSGVLAIAISDTMFHKCLNMVGAGIFTTSGLLMADLHHPLLMILLWILVIINDLWQQNLCIIHGIILPRRCQCSDLSQLGPNPNWICLNGQQPFFHPDPLAIWFRD